MHGGVALGHEFDDARRSEAGQPGQQLGKRNVASDRQMVLEREREQRICPGALCETGPLRLLPALIRTGVRGIEEQGQERQPLARSARERGFQHPLIEVETDDVAGARLQRQDRIIADIAAEIEHQPRLGLLHELGDEAPFRGLLIGGVAMRLCVITPCRRPGVRRLQPCDPAA